MKKFKKDDFKHITKTLNYTPAFKIDKTKMLESKLKPPMSSGIPSSIKQASNSSSALNQPSTTQSKNSLLTKLSQQLKSKFNSNTKIEDKNETDKRKSLDLNQIMTNTGKDLLISDF